jgi:signal peptidase I
MRRRFARLALAGVCGGLLLVAGYYAAPPQLGGHTAYVTTFGTSMEPLIHPGDLVIVRELPPYGIGDVVAYRSPELREVVLHRIVARDGSRFVFKGDNNAWLDSYHPTQDELVGRMVIRLPGVGGRIGTVRTPAGLSTIVGLGAVGVLGGRRRRRTRGAHEAVEVERRPPSNGDGGGGASAVTRRPRSGGGSVGVILGAVAVLALAFSGILFPLPETVVQHREVVYSQVGSFSYSASVPGGKPVYGRTTAHTGDPVYIRLADAMTMSFRYTLDTPGRLQATGTIGLTAEVSNVSGWTRPVPLADPATFEGGTATASGTLDLAALVEMTRRLEEATGVVGGQYTLTVTPDVELNGTLSGRPLTESFTPSLRFLLDPLQIQLLPEGQPEPGAQPSNSLTPSSGSSVRIDSDVPRMFSFAGVSVGLPPLRAGVLALAGCALVGLLMMGISRLRARRRGESARIEARFGKWLIPVHTDTLPSLNRFVEVESFDSLVRLAEHYGHVILHEDRQGAHAYFVEESGVTYRYRAVASR